MKYRGSRLTLTAHMIFATGWLGAVLAYVALAIAGFTSSEPSLVRAAYQAMQLLGWCVIVPTSLLALASGMLKSFDTRWGVLQHWWVIAKGVLTVGGIVVLLQHMQAVTRVADAAVAATFSTTELRFERLQLVLHPIGGLFVLVVATVLSIYKPWGLTPYGRRFGQSSLTGQAARIYAPAVTEIGVASHSSQRKAFGWQRVLGIHAIGVAVLVLVFHIAGGGLRHH
jgi:hypothetical protein